MKNKIGMSAKNIALIGAMTAAIEVGKIELMAIPNVEVVSLLISVFGYVFGFSALLSTCLFVVIETLLWGFGSWVIAYSIHWNILCFLFCVLGMKRIENKVLLTTVALVMTTLFGVLTSLIEIGLFSGTFSDFGYRFAIYYSRGASFYITQIVCNAILFPLAFMPIKRVLIKAKNKYEL